MLGFLVPNSQSSLQIIDSFRNPVSFDSRYGDNFLLSSQFQIFSSSTMLEILESYPKEFKITNQGKEYYFSSQVIRDLSVVIKKLNQDVNEFSLDINDPFDSMQKFTDVLNGKVVTVEIKQERPFFKKLAQILQVNLPPSISAPSNMKVNYQCSYSSKTLKMSILSNSVQNLAQKNPKNFIIKTNDNRYNCNYMTVVLSKKIASALAENPQLTEFDFEIEDSNKQFQIFCDFFNFLCCQITSQNIDFIEKVASDLDIKCIQNRISEYRNKFDDGQKVLDIEQDQIELVTTLQEQLFNLSDETLDETIENLIKTIWLKDSERIKEFSSNLAIVATYRPELHPVLIKFIKRISEKVPDFLPFFKPYIMFLSSNSLGSFIYQMYKANLLELDLILENIWENIIFDHSEDQSSVTTQLFLWFLPELDAKFPFIIDNLSFQGNVQFAGVILERNLETFKANNWEIYKENRDNIYNSDPFAKAIIADDTDKFQSLLTTIQFDMNYKIQSSIFENFEPMFFIDYAALHSSVACFKYMVLNHAEITTNTLVNSIKGGNTEIIRVSEMATSNEWQNSITGNNNNMNNNGPMLINHNFVFMHNRNFFFNDNAMQISPGYSIFKEAVQYHRYGIFEWLIQTMTDQSVLIQILQSCMMTVILTNNIVSLMSIIDSGVNLTSKNQSLNSALKQNAISAASRGYSDLLKIIIALTDKSIFLKPQNQMNQNQKIFRMNPNQRKLLNVPKTILEAASSFGSLRIIKMMIIAREDKPISQDEIESSLIAAASRGHLDVIKLWIEILHPSETAATTTEEKNLSLSKESNDNDNDNDNDVSNESDFNLLDTESSFKKAILKFANMDIEISPSSYTKFLQKAAYFGHVDIIKFFINKEDCDWNQILESAAQHGQLEIVKFIIKSKFGQNEDERKKKDLTFNQAFCLAAQNGFYDVCNFFAENNYLSLTANLVGEILGEIASKGYIEILKLIFKIIPSDTSSRLNNKYLNSAIENGQIIVASLFIELGGARNDTLIKASRKGLFEVVKLLCEHPEYQNNEDDNDSNKPSQLYINNVTMNEGSALCAAASGGSIETVEYLLKQPGIDLDLYNSMHETAIITAARNKHFQIMKMIINAHKEEEMTGKQIWQLNTAFVSYYMAKPTTQTTVNERHVTTFGIQRDDIGFRRNKRMNGKSNGIEKVEFDYDVLNYFLEFKGINPNFVYEGVTPLIAAISQENIDCVASMICHPEIDVNFPSKNGYTPLMMAVQTGNLRLVELLLNNENVNVNYSNKNFESALSISAHGPNIGDRIATAITSCPRFKADHSNTNEAVMTALDFNNNSIFNHLITLDFDINKKVQSRTKFGTYESVVYSVCMWNGDVEHNLPLILNHPRFDPNQNDLIGCIFGLCKQNELTSFNSILNLLHDDVNIKNSQGTSLLVESVKMRADIIAQTIVGSPNFDPEKSDVKTAFAYSLLTYNLFVSLLIDQPGIDINAPIYLYRPFGRNALNTNYGYETYRNMPPFQIEEYDNFFLMNEGEEIDFCNEEQIENGFNITIGHTALTIACQNPQIMETLLNHDGIDINRKCDDGSAPVFEAISMQNSMSLEELIRRPELDLNIQNNDGMTPLIFAISNRFDYAINIILTKENIDLTIKDKNGFTAYDYLIYNYKLIRDDFTEPKTLKEFAKLYNVACQLNDFGPNNW